MMAFCVQLFAWQSALKHMDPTGGWPQFTDVIKSEYCSS